MTDLKRIQRDYNLTQTQIAKITGYSRECINKLIKSNKPMPKPMLKLLKIYTAYRNIATRHGNWRVYGDIDLFARITLDILDAYINLDLKKGAEVKAWRRYTAEQKAKKIKKVKETLRK